MANEWIQSDGAACYNSLSPGFALGQNDVFDIGNLYAVEFTVSGMTQGKLIVEGLEGTFEYTEDGEYLIIDKAIGSNLTFIGQADEENEVFDGCINIVTRREIPYYRIEDLDGNIVFELSDDTGVSASGQNIQYQIDWTSINNGCYKIIIPDSGLEYESDCLNLELTHDCTILLSWTNNENAFGFNYSDLNFTPKLRAVSKKWQPKYTKEKTVFKDSSGVRSLLKSETSKEELLTVGESPEYIHDALSVGLENDFFYIDGVKYNNEETEYTPKWRKSSQLAPVEIVVIKDQNLKNSNC